MDNYRLSKFTDSLYICGFMGTGKSTLGKKLAVKLDKPFIDLDSEIEKRAAMSIPEIFQKQGEAAFRSMEWEVLKDITKTFKGVIALGGGTLQEQRIVDHIKLSGLLIFLDTPFATVLDRVKRNKNRPLLLDEQGQVKEDDVLQNDLSTLLEKRRPLYEQAQIKIKRSEYEDLDQLVEDLSRRIARYV